MLVDIVRRSASACFFLITLGAPALSINILHVNAAAQPPFDGSSFAHGFQTIQQAVDAAQTQDEIWVQEGTYVENVNCPKAIQFTGGFSGSETFVDQANPVAYPTTIDGGGKGPAIVMTSLNQETYGFQTVDGFTVQNGTGSTFAGKNIGGGVLLVGNGSIARCTFKNNSASYGGAVGLYGGGPWNIFNNVFTNNRAAYGCAIAEVDTSTSTYHNTFSQNSKPDGATSTRGGAIYVQTGYPQIDSDEIFDNTFSNNTADGGGAIALVNAAKETIRNNTLTANSALNGSGGAIYVENSSPVLINGNVFASNGAWDKGNAIYAGVSGSGSVVITDNMLTKNGSVSGDAAIATAGAFVVNNTIVDNPRGGVSIYTPSYTANNIIAFNGWGITETGGIVPGPIQNNDVYGNAKDYQNLPDATGSAGNIQQDPVFLDRAGGDDHIQGSSPCIDAGNQSDAVAYATAKDFDGEIRIFGPSVDIGADEFVPILVFTTQPGNGRPGKLLSSQPILALRDRTGNALSQFNGPVALSIDLNSGTFGAALGGTTTVNTVDGVATFTDLSIDTVGKGYILEASSPTFTGTASVPIDVLLQRSYVSSIGKDYKDGSTWDTAKASIPAAIGVNGGPDGEVWVANGTYTGPVRVPDGITLYGGFAGTETDFGQRHTQSKNTVITGSSKNTVVQFIDSSGNGIDGFRITGGGGYPVTDNLKSIHQVGGGVYVGNASPVIANNLITGNAALFGGGLYVDGGRPVIRGNTITNNAAVAVSSTAGAGGGAALLKGVATLSDNVIMDNSAVGENSAHSPSLGGALLISGAHDIHNNTIVMNQSPASQGDIVILGGSPAFTNDIIANRAAIEKLGGTPTFSHNDYLPGARVNSQLSSITGTNGNINQAVTFVNSTGGNFHLPSDSPLLDIAPSPP